MTDGTALREIAAEILTEILGKGTVYTSGPFSRLFLNISIWKNQTARF